MLEVPCGDFLQKLVNFIRTFNIFDIVTKIPELKIK